ncbi:MAG: hypothetical protein M1423_01130 [Acidobacteria bacterium]|nr:hypothetical protein [Acidobacteriota bacterium]
MTLNNNWISPTLTNPIGRLTYATTTASGSVQTAPNTSDLHFAAPS